MIAILALILATASLGISLALAVRLRAVTERFPESPSPALVADALRPLEGLKVSLAIEQDHAHPVFANLLKELLLREDVELVPNADLLIRGKLVCNGYADVYYSADFTCEIAGEPFCTLIERPPHGDRPGNLALELVTRLKTELAKSASRGERRQAIRELQGP